MSYPVADWRIIDVIDGTDPSLRCDEQWQIEQSGVKPIVMMRGIGDKCIPYMVDAVIRELEGPRRMKMLRIHGHGHPGIQALAAGLHIWPESDDKLLLTYQNVERIATTLARLAPYFTADGKVWLMGCETGQGEKGKTLLSGLAKAWRVPVTAGVLPQAPGGLSTFQHIGPTVTMYPSG
jgi:hypothetical protein